jgi:hypothetical protein
MRDKGTYIECSKCGVWFAIPVDGYDGYCSKCQGAAESQISYTLYESMVRRNQPISTEDWAKGHTQPHCWRCAEVQEVVYESHKGQFCKQCLFEVEPQLSEELLAKQVARGDRPVWNYLMLGGE